jgi:outer membrane protein assembly factor BamB
VQLGKQLITAFFLFVLVNSLSAQDNWPEFRGPTGDGVAPSISLPTELGDQSNIAWEVPIHGRGWSSPVIWGEQIWLTSATEDGKEMFGICVALKTGRVIYDKLIYKNENPRFRHATNSYASCTPAIEAGRVYLHFGSYGTTCIDTETGETIWSRKDFECDHFRGPGSSPILYGDNLIVAYDGSDKQYVVALNKKTGKTAWKTDRNLNYGTDNGDWKKAYGTASVFDIEGKPILIYPSAKATVAYNPINGEPMWTVYHDGMNASARPILTEDGLVILTNGMGRMDAVNPHGTGDITNTNIGWTISKNVTRRPSPILVSGNLFMFNDKGIASCVRAKDGEILWQKRIGGSFAASPIFDGEHIFAFGEQGEIFAFQPGDSYQVIDETQLGDGFKASPAVAGDRLIVRSISKLYCLNGKLRNSEAKKNNR